MLVLGRKLDETVNIYTSDGVIAINVEEIKRSFIRLSFDAPPNVTIVRREIDQMCIDD